MTESQEIWEQVQEASREGWNLKAACLLERFRRKIRRGVPFPFNWAYLSLAAVLTEWKLCWRARGQA